MKSFFARIKRKFNNTFVARYLYRLRNNNTNNIYNNSFTGIMSAPETFDDPDNDSVDDANNAAVDQPIIDPKTQVKYFSTILNKRDIEFDYSLFDIKRLILEHKIKIEDLVLDDVYATTTTITVVTMTHV